MNMKISILVGLIIKWNGRTRRLTRETQIETETKKLLWTDRGLTC